MRKWLKSLREKKNLTQEQVANAVNISRQYYQMIENGIRCEPNKNETEKKIADILGFDWTKFFEDGTAEAEIEDCMTETQKTDSA